MSPPPTAIAVRGAHVHNLRHIDVDIPLNEMVGIAGVSGSGKSSLALGVLYAEGSRRYLEALSAYTRRRLTQAARAQVDDIRNVPAALALHQRPAVPGVRSTFGTMTELLNNLRLMMSRLGSHMCPNGHMVPPSADIAQDKPLTCPTCGAVFYGPSAEDFSFNSSGACPTCGGTGVVRTVDEAALIPDPDLTIDEGAVAPWRSLMWSLMAQVVREMGVRTDVPYKDLTAKEKQIVIDGPAVKKHILYQPKSGTPATELDFTYYSAKRSVLNALDKAKDETGMKRIARFLKEGTCPDCHGTRLNKRARSSTLDGLTLPAICAMTLGEADPWVAAVPGDMPAELKAMGRQIADQFAAVSRRLLDLGLDYLTLERAGSTLSTGERQRVQLARAVRNQTTGVLYVLDEPSIGLHPANVDGLLAVVQDLIAHGNSVVLVDHDVRVLRAADWMVEMGPGAGFHGGNVVAQGTVRDLEDDPGSVIGGFLAGRERVHERPALAPADVFAHGAIELRTEPLHTVHALDVKFPKQRLIAVTGVSGSGKSTLVLESLVPALAARARGERLPAHVASLDAPGIAHVHEIDATPIGANVRSTVATYSGVLDHVRKVFAGTPEAKKRGLKPGDFSYNTGSLRCPTCDGTGQIVMDVQFLPDVTVDCPDCQGLRYAPAARDIRYVPRGRHGGGVDAGVSLPELMGCTIDQAIDWLHGLPKVRAKLQTLSDLGLGYLTLGEATPVLSGGEAQRLKLASHMGRAQDDAVFVFDEPTIGLHPKDVELLMRIFRHLVDHGATVIVIEHDLDFIANADWVIDMGPGGGVNGGRVIATGTPAQVAADPESLTGRYLAADGMAR
ncbi:MAG: excinuclease ABC subunit UvrA [Bifidobacterium sp.]|nr:excinuclease ABC subunit UvrA [Bifidobacterium sp.]